MNLDGNMSPIILNILPMLTSLPNHRLGYLEGDTIFMIHN